MSYRTLIACIALVPVLATAQTPTDVFIVSRPAPKAGDTHSWSFDVKFQAMGQDARFTATLVRKVLKIDDNGDVTWESRMNGGKVNIMGNDMEQPSDPSTKVYDKDGRPKGDRESMNDLEELLTLFASIRPPKEGITAGKTFEYENKDHFSGSSEAKVVGDEAKDGHQCLKLEVTYNSASGEGKGTGNVFLDKATGIMVYYEAKFTNLAVAAGIVSDGTATAKLLDAK